MPYGLEAMTGVLPTIVVAGAATQMVGGMFGGHGQQPAIGQAWSGHSGWQPISKKEAYDTFGKRKADMARKNPGREYTYGYDKLRFANGKFWLA